MNKKLSLTHVYSVYNGIIIGILTGMVISLFRLIVAYIFKNLIYWYQLSRNSLFYLLLIITINLIIGIIVYRLIKQEPNIKGAGIPSTKKVLSKRNLHYSAWSVLWRKFIGSTLTVASGVFMGHEGPSIQMGAAIGQGFAEYTKQPKNSKKTIIAGGAAAGLAAVFNTPIASTLFVLEGIYNSFYIFTWLTALTASLVSNGISTLIFGERPILFIPNLHTLPLSYYVHLIILGLILGILGYLYQNFILKIRKMYQNFKWLPKQLNVFIPLLLMIPIGMYYPQAIGSGNSLVLTISNFTVPLGTLIIYTLIRILGPALANGSGLPGGMLVPLLTLGALLGAVYGYIIFDLNLIPAQYIINFAIVGMAGFFSSIKKTPFTPVILVTEMVGSLHHLSALAVVSLIAYIINDLTKTFTK